MNQVQVQVQVQVSIDSMKHRRLFANGAAGVDRVIVIGQNGGHGIQRIVCIHDCPGVVLIIVHVPRPCHVDAALAVNVPAGAGHGL